MGPQRHIHQPLDGLLGPAGPKRPSGDGRSKRVTYPLWIPRRVSSPTTRSSKPSDRILNKVCLRHDHCSAPRPRIVPPFGTALSQAPMRFRSFGDPCGNRTRVTGVRGRCLNRLTNGPRLAARLRRSAASRRRSLKGLASPLDPGLCRLTTTRSSRPSDRIPDKVCLAAP